MTRPPLRGRETELTELRRRLNLLAGGRGGAVVVEGTAGSGKTRLLAEVSEQARTQGLRVFTGAGQQAWQVLELLDGLPGTSTSAGPDDVVRELQEGLERAALDTPVLVVLDDFQWADAAAATAVRTLLRRLAADPVLWLIARRPSASRDLDADVLSLGDLDEAAVEQVARDVLGTTPHPHLSELLAGAQGNPLLLGELLHDIKDGQLRAGEAVTRSGLAPQRFRESIRRQVRQLSEPARAAVELAAILGRTFTAGQLARMLDRSPATLLSPLREALDAQLILEQSDRFAFRHDLVREAIETGLPEPLRRDLRRQAIEASLAEGAPAADVAALVLQTATHGDTRSIALLQLAAAEIAPRSPLVAARLSTRALDLARPGAAKGALLTDAVTQLVLAGEVDEASALFERYAAAALEPPTAARLRCLLAEVLLPADATRSATLCHEALALPDLPEHLRARLCAALANALIISGDAAGGRRHAQAAQALAAKNTDPLLMSAVVITDAVSGFQQCDWETGLHKADQAIRLRDQVPGARALWLPDGYKAMMLDAMGRLSEAWQLTEAGLRLARADGQHANEWTWAMIRARILLRSGRLNEAQAEAEGIQAMSEELGTALFRGFASSVLAHVALHRGDPNLLPAARSHAATMGPGKAWKGRGQWLRALLDEASGTPAVSPDPAMDDLFSGCVDIVALSGHAETATLVRLLLRADQPERAEAAVERLTAEASRHPQDRLVAAAEMHARGMLLADPDRLSKAVEMYDADERLLLKARVYEDAGVAMARTDRSAGVALLDSALNQWSSLGADHDAGRVRSLLRQHGVRRRAPEGPQTGWAGLTESETRVARLVALGRTNRQVADELHLSPHTVSTHLRHAFVKLNIRTRTELARLSPDTGLSLGR
ncbi:ATP-binding protein [Kineosporia babensis]|uniref:AAA family ATPase n=1 Tax=Kineosporia babensis TaxID=499548 RepID=A0A9X1NEY9_9ACTN|nr:LuxR family transcriptional regulator [Kineosporia babensis]MCD5311853.1 AAA family ATPase [Kineosporia babensis]